MEIEMIAPNTSPVVLIPGEFDLPILSPAKNDVIGIGDVNVTFENIEDESDNPEKKRSRLEVFFWFLSSILKNYVESCLIMEKWI
jgi:hypothetical protein